MTCEDPFAERVYQRRHENIEKVLRDLRRRDKDLLRRISKWAEKFGYDRSVIEQKVSEDDIFRCCMAKDPTRQNIYESTAIDIISAFDSQLVSRFEKLPGGGSNAIYIQGRALRTGAQLIEASSKETKSIDFRWWIPRSDGEIEVYASHKYTQEPGGAQDNQFEDVKRFLEAARTVQRKNTIFIAICDGPYFTTIDTKSSTPNITKMETLKRITDRCTTFATTIFSLEELLEEQATKELDG